MFYNSLKNINSGLKVSKKLFIIALCLNFSSKTNAQYQQPQYYNPQLGYNTNNQYAAPSPYMYQTQPASYQYIMPQQQQYIPIKVETKRSIQPSGYLPNYGKSSNKSLTQDQIQNALSEGGFYVGIGFGFNTSTGSVVAEKCPEYAQGVGNCGDTYETEDGEGGGLGSGNGISFVAGAPISNKIRIEASYSMYSGYSYGDTAIWKDDAGFNVDIPVEDGGEIESNVLMASIYYNLDGFFSSFMGYNFVPYLGAGIGYSFNTINDYRLYDAMGWSEPCNDEATCGILMETVYRDGLLTYIGETTRNLSWMIGAGVGFEVSDTMTLDVFYKRMSLGKVSTSGKVYMDYIIDEWLWDDEYGEEYLEQEVGYLQEFKEDYIESGSFVINEFGVVLRIYF